MIRHLSLWPDVLESILQGDALDAPQQEEEPVVTPEEGQGTALKRTADEAVEAPADDAPPAAEGFASAVKVEPSMIHDALTGLLVTQRMDACIASANPPWLAIRMPARSQRKLVQHSRRLPMAQ